MGWEDELTDEETPTTTDRMAILLPFLVGGTALAAGALVGLAGGYAIGVAQAPSADAAAHVVTADDITFAKVCAPVREEAETRIGTLNHEISSLQHDIDARKARLVEMEAEMERRADAGRKMWKEFEETREKLAIAMQQKASLEQEKADLILELTRTEAKLAQTEEALDDQVELTEQYRFESLDYNFERFVHEAQLNICERGNRKKLGNCRERVADLLVSNELEDAFRHCVRSGQENPVVRELGKEEGLPDFGRFLGQDERMVRDWYIQLCDPTLPEADVLVADAVQELRTQG